MPRTKRGLATLNKILNAAIQVFYEKGYHNSSISDITGRAGVAAGTFYVYFDGKYNLYKFLLYQCSHTIRRHLSQATAHCTTRREVERVGLRAWLEYTMENQYVYHIIWESLYVDYNLFREYYETFSSNYQRGLSQAVEQQELGDIDPEVLSFALMGITNFLGLNWCLFERNPDKIDHVVEEFMKILDHGIFATSPMPPMAPPPGRGSPPQAKFQFELDQSDLEHMV